MKQISLQAFLMIGCLMVGYVIGAWGDWMGTHKTIDDLRWSMEKAQIGHWNNKSDGTSRFVIDDKFRRR